MKRIIVGAVVAAVTLAAAPGTTPSEGQEQAPGEAGAVTTQPTVVKRERIYPKRTIRKSSRFTPWAQPNRAQVDTIVATEAARWRAPSWRLHCRINGESGYRWWVINSGGYAGLGQFGKETFYRGMSSIGSRLVRLVDRRTTTRPTILVRHWSDGTITRERSKRIRVQVIHTYKGKIPRWPARTHGWAQVRIMARAMVGLGRVNDSEWEVRCRR